MSSLSDPVSPSPAPNTSLVDTGVGDKATRAAFLSLFIIVGFVGNCVLVATIAQSSRLKSSSINLCIISLAVANILDSAGNMPIILGATITEKWDYGKLACHLNAFGLQMVSIAVITGLMLLTVDRFVAVLDPHRHRERMGSRRIGAVIGFFWIYSVAFSVPLMLDSIVPIKVFPVRYLCTITNDTPLLYLCLTSIFCFLIPIGICVSLLAYIVKRAVQLKRKEAQERQHLGYVQGTQTPNKLWTELEGAKFAGVMFTLWLVLQAPYLVLSSIMWYRNSRELAGNKTVNDFLYFEYPWELELALTWLKLSYPVFLPAVTFLWKKRVWERCKNAMLCRKSNLVVHASPDSSPGNGTTIVDNGVPVLFATENGLHIQTYNEDESDDGDPVSDAREYSNSQVVVTKECDVYGSQFLQLDGEDTSDYDSSSDLDPFSNSNPPSELAEYGHKRSVSSGKLANSKPKVANSVARPENRSASEPHLQAAAADEVPKSAAAKTNCSRTRRRQRSEGAESIRQIESFPNSDHAVARKESVVVGDADDACQVTERTSHDSGVGSLGNSRKSKKHRKKRTSSSEEDVRDCERRDEAKRDETKALESESASPQTNPKLEPQNGKGRSRKKRHLEDENNPREAEHNDDENFDDVVTHRKVPVRLPPLAVEERKPMERLEPEIDGATRRPTVAPRKVNTRKPAKDIRDGVTVSRPVPEPRQSIKAADAEDKVTLQCLPSRTIVVEDQSCDCSRDDDEVSGTDVSKQKADFCGTVEEPSLVDPVPRKTRRKRRHKLVDREAQQRKLDEELEIQGVLY